MVNLITAYSLKFFSNIRQNCVIGVTLFTICTSSSKIRAQNYISNNSIDSMVVNYLSERNYFKFLTQKDSIRNGYINFAKGRYYVFKLFRLDRTMKNAIYVFGENGSHSRRYLLIKLQNHYVFYGDRELEQDLLEFNEFSKTFKPTISDRNKLKVYEILIENFDYVREGVLIDE